MIEASQLFKCLSNETRLYATLLIKQQGELCVCELTAALDLSQPKMSRHLAQLRNCGILKDSRRGQWVYYAIEPSLPQWAKEILETAYQANPQVIAEYIGRLETMSDHPSCCP